MGYYVVVEATSERIRLSPPPASRRGWAIIFSGLAGLFFALQISILRTRPPLGEALSSVQGAGDLLKVFLSYCAFLLLGVGFLVAAGLAWGWWSELEWDAMHRTIFRRRYLFGRIWRTSTLSFDQVDEIRVVRIRGQYSMRYYHLFIISQGRVWATLPGYRDEGAVRALRRQLLRFMGYPVG
ncbi:MAG TPA: hypothetical protein G4O00_04360 [Thermoflexia bacterium]|nr:hypothetical protein [Thermoflexia bacterium]